MTLIYLQGTAYTNFLMVFTFYCALKAIHIAFDVYSSLDNQIYKTIYLTALSILVFQLPVSIYFITLTAIASYGLTRLEDSVTRIYRSKKEASAKGRTLNLPNISGVVSKLVDRFSSIFRPTVPAAAIAAVPGAGARADETATVPASAIAAAAKEAAAKEAQNAAEAEAAAKEAAAGIGSGSESVEEEADETAAAGIGSGSESVEEEADETAVAPVPASAIAAAEAAAKEAAAKTTTATESGSLTRRQRKRQRQRRAGH